ncbi:hypothetical protein SAMN04487897_101100 [Paenibacillus sp. yr247]|nr:hypothetical protein SAMN04487897_101100 [Paenibacillus sp. yr247]
MYHLKTEVLTSSYSTIMMHVPVGTMPHEDVMKAIDLLGTEVAPRVREEISRWEAVNEAKM